MLSYSTIRRRMPSIEAPQLWTMTPLARLVQDAQLRAVLGNYTAGGKWGRMFDSDPEEPPRLNRNRRWG
jgi:hypothetical protein